MAESVNGISFNPAGITNSNTSGSKAEHKEEEKEQEVQQVKAEQHSVAPEDVLNFMTNAAFISRANLEPKTTVKTPMGMAAGEMFEELAPIVAAGIRENTHAVILSKAEQYRKDHPGIDARMDVAMQVFEEEFGAFPAFIDE